MNGTTQWFRMSWALIAMLSLVGGLVAANEAVENEKEPMAQTTRLQPALEKARDLIGAKVVNLNGDRLGKVEDIVLTGDRSQISYVALSHGGFLGIGEKLFAVPWSAFEIRTENGDKILVLDVTAEHLKDMKGFDKGHWPTVADTATWTKHMRSSGISDEMHRSDPGPVTREEIGHSITAMDMKDRRLTKLIGLDIKNPQGEVLGELENAVINVDRGNMAYGIVLVSSGFWGMDRQVAPVPWSAIEITDRPLTVRLNADKEMLEAIAFDADAYPDLGNTQYSRDIHQRFNATPYWEVLGYVPGEPQREREMAPSRDANIDYDKMYDPDNVKTLSGTVENVGAFDFEGVSSAGLRLRIRTEDDKIMTVHAGPRSYAQRHNISFEEGDHVTVVGSPAKIGGQDVILAAQIKKGDQTLDLRSRDGKPLWKADTTKNDR